MPLGPDPQRLAAQALYVAARKVYERAKALAHERGMTETDVYYCACGYFGNRSRHANADGRPCSFLARRLT